MESFEYRFCLLETNLSLDKACFGFMQAGIGIVNNTIDNHALFNDNRTPYILL